MLELLKQSMSDIISKEQFNEVIPMEWRHRLDKSPCKEKGGHSIKDEEGRRRYSIINKDVAKAQQCFGIFSGKFQKFL